MINKIHEQTLQAIEHLIIKREKSHQHQQDLANQMIENSIVLDRKWSITQLHVLSLIGSSNETNNTVLAQTLNISKPAITKAINILIDQGMIVTTKKPNNNKEVYYVLTDKGQQLTAIHDKLHKIAEERYIQLFNLFSEQELHVVIRFLTKWAEQLET